MRRLAKEMSPDVAIGFMHSVYIPLGLALVGSDIPVVASEHIAYDHYRTRPLQAALLRLTPALARAITVISPAVRDGFPVSLRRRMVAIPNPVEAPVSRSADAAGGPVKTLLSVGRLEEQKDHRTLIDAFASIAADFPDWRLRIIGEGTLRAGLEAQVKRLGLIDRVSLPGATDRINEEYAAAQLVAMPSSYESFGLATAEALGYGLPVVGFADCPGTNELVKNGVNGLLVTGRDRPAALAEGLAGLMQSPERRQLLGAAGPLSIADFAPERVADEWEKLLSRIACAE
jgi:glycosyltransferase involved in cell wall biosynthesis